MREILSIGECMVELARRPDGAFDLRVGGDTFNTSIYLARMGATVSYLTAIGDDPYSAKIIEAAEGEGVGTSDILTIKGRMPGLYFIETENGERRFWYWRDRAPARELFELPGHQKLLHLIAEADTIYLSGITLSLYSEAGLDQLDRSLAAARRHGGKVALDGNFRPIGWGHDRERAQATYRRFWAHADVALPSFDDECALWGDQTPADTLARFVDFGVQEICLKLADQGAIVATKQSQHHVEPEAVVSPTDSTAAGDSFNAGYLWARLNDQAPVNAARLGNRLASIVIQHPGAIVPPAATAGIRL